MPNEWKIGLGAAIGAIAPVGLDLALKGKTISQLGNIKAATLGPGIAGVGTIIAAAMAPPKWGLTTEDKLALGIAGGLMIGIGTLVQFLPAPSFKKYNIAMTPEQRQALIERQRMLQTQRGTPTPPGYSPEIVPEISVLA